MLTFREIIRVSLNFRSNCCHTLLGVLAVANNAVTPFDELLFKLISNFLILSQQYEVLGTLHQKQQHTLQHVVTHMKHKHSD